MSLVALIALFFAGVGAGIMNTVGGGGSILTLPALIFLGGVPETSANATNRIGLVIQNAVGLWRFRRGGVVEDTLSLRLLGPCLVGAWIGSSGATMISDAMFRPVLAWTMLALLVVILLQPRRPAMEAAPEDPFRGASPRRRVGLYVAMFLLSIYMGFMQAGAGIIMLVVLGWFLKMDLVRANYVKLYLILATNVLAFANFIWSGIEIFWMAGVMLFAGQTVGAYFGSWVALSRGEGWIKVILGISIIASSAKLLGWI